jgi:hypothetical protein
MRVIKMVELSDIKLFPSMGEGTILVRYDLKFVANNVLYECLGVAERMMCVGYGTRESDVNIILLKLETVVNTDGDVKSTIRKVAKQIVDKITELEGLC